MLWGRTLLAALLVASALADTLHPVAAQVCSVSIDYPDYSPNVAQEQTLEIRGTFHLSCTQSGKHIVTRAELLEKRSQAVLWTNSIDLGFAANSLNDWTLTVNIPLTAPSASGTWELSLRVYIFSGDQLATSDEKHFRIQIGESVQEGLVNVLELQNGDFEDGLSGWVVIDSGKGSSTLSSSISHSGSSSLQLDLRPTTSVTQAEIQGVSQHSSIENLRSLEAQAWFLTSSCAFPDGTTGRISVQVDQLGIEYNVNATCGAWQQIDLNVTMDFEARYGLGGLEPFQREGSVSLTFALQLVRSGANAMALAEYVSMNWDDVQLIASVPTTMSTELTTTSTTSMVSTTSMNSEASTSTVQATTSTTMPLEASTSQMQMPWPLLAILSLALFLVAFFMIAPRVLRRKQRAVNVSRSGPFCPECGASLSKRIDAKFCQECGAEISQR